MDNPTHHRPSDNSDSPESKKTRASNAEATRWLNSLGLNRKPIARNGSCIFRAVSDTRYLTQSYFSYVRKELIEYTERLCPKQFLLLSHQDDVCKESYLKMLRDPVYYKPSTIDLCIISMMYGYNFRIYWKPHVPPLEISVTEPRETISLYTDSENSYDLLYTDERYRRLAFCQHLIYQVYYEHVFKLEDIEYAVQKMLSHGDSPSRLVPGYGFMDMEGYVPNLSVNKQVLPLGLVYAKRFEMRAKCHSMRRLLAVGITPFPYKVAKALDPDIYRNTEFDVWVEQKRGPRCGLEIWSNTRLVPGVSCILRFPTGEGVNCHIQKVDITSKEAEVYIVKNAQGRMMTVSIDWLEPLVDKQVLVAHRKYLRGSWAEATENVLARKTSTNSETQVHIEELEEEVSFGQKLDEPEYTSPLPAIRGVSATHPVSANPPVLSTTHPVPANPPVPATYPMPAPPHVPATPVLYGPDQEHMKQDLTEAWSAPPPPYMKLSTVPPVCYEQPVPAFYPPPITDWPLDPYAQATYGYQGGLDYNMCSQEVPPAGFAPLHPDMTHISPAVYPAQHKATSLFPPGHPQGIPPIVYTPEVHTAPSVLYPGHVFPVCSDQGAYQTVFPLSMPPPEMKMNMYPTDLSYTFVADPVLAEVDPYLLPPSNFYCHPSGEVYTLSPPNSPDLPYYSFVHQTV